LDAAPVPVSDDFEGVAEGSMVVVGLAVLPDDPAEPDVPTEAALEGLLGE
jgi:hypothetical protein